MRILVLALCVVALAGCGGGPRRVEVRGKVSYDGRPIEEGEIRFVPATADMGALSGASISNGTYELAGAGAVPAGRHRVEITAYRPVPDHQPDPNLPFVPKEQYLPDKYNRRTILEYEVLDIRGPLVKDFELAR